MTKAKGVLGRDVARGLRKGGLHLQRKSQEITPVDWGDLYSSSFVRNIGGSGFKTDIVVGFGSEGVGYAVFVHEDLNAAHGKFYNLKYAREIAKAKISLRQYKKAGGKGGKAIFHNRGEKQQAKFLEKPARDERKVIIRIIHREARI